MYMTSVPRAKIGTGRGGNDDPSQCLGMTGLETDGCCVWPFEADGQTQKTICRCTGRAAPRNCSTVIIIHCSIDIIMLHNNDTELMPVPANIAPKLDEGSTHSCTQLNFLAVSDLAPQLTLQGGRGTCRRHSTSWFPHTSYRWFRA